MRLGWDRGERQEEGGFGPKALSLFALGPLSPRLSILGQPKHKMIVEPILGYPRLAGGVPREFS
jgi:hypothetical protein